MLQDNIRQIYILEEHGPVSMVLRIQPLPVSRSYYLSFIELTYYI